jgi:hypothetical protein
MGWFTASKHLAEPAATVLLEMTGQDSSETNAVVDCLNTIAGNGVEEAETEYLASCAENIAIAALDFINHTNSVPSLEFEENLLKFLLYGKSIREAAEEQKVHVQFNAADVQGYFVISTEQATEFLREYRHEIQDKLIAIGNETIEQLGTHDELKRVDEDSAEDDEPPQDVRVEGG